MLNIRCFLSLVFVMIASLAFAQPSPNDLKDKAETYYANQHFHKALPLFLDYQTFQPEELSIKYKIGVCYLELSNAGRAKDYLEFVTQAKKPIGNAFYHLARSYQMLEEFDEALRMYKRYLAVAKLKEEDRDLIKEEIKRCLIARKLIWKEQSAVVESMGDRVNTVHDEFNPVIDPYEPNTVYFSSVRPDNIGGMVDENGQIDTLAGKAKADIFVSRVIKGQWSTGASLGDELNTAGEDIIQDFSESGAQIVTWNEAAEAGIHVQSFFAAEEDNIGFLKLPYPINGENWTGDAYFFKDSIVIFSSDRPGGYGGKDLWYTLRLGGFWIRPRNFGPLINSDFDEVTPFLAKDGRTLYYSSNNLLSSGGHDIFKTSFSDSLLTWLEPENLGFPINSPADESFFRLDEEGLKGYFASNRNGGNGGSDIYTAYFQDYLPEQSQEMDPMMFALIGLPVPDEQMETILDIVEPESTNPDEGKEEIFIPDDPNVVDPPVARSWDFEFAPIFYDSEGQQLSPSTIETLDQYADILKAFPQTKLELTAHTDNSGFASNNLYFSLRRAELLADYLADNGVNPTQIEIKAVGSNYPQAKDTNEDGSENVVAQNLNRRIEANFHNLSGTPVIIKYSSPLISNLLSTSEATNYKSAISGLSYKVQVAAVKTRFTDPVVGRFQDATIEATPASDHKRYMLGLASTFVEIERIRQILISEGYADVFVVPYVNGQRLDKEGAIEYAAEYADLNRFLTAVGREASMKDKKKVETTNLDDEGGN
ncbi:MAG: OmpA family protein [Bacteroidota bacterium]